MGIIIWTQADHRSYIASDLDEALRLIDHAETHVAAAVGRAHAFLDGGGIAEIEEQLRNLRAISAVLGAWGDD